MIYNVCVCVSWLLLYMPLLFYLLLLNYIFKFTYNYKFIPTHQIYLLKRKKNLVTSKEISTLSSSSFAILSKYFQKDKRLSSFSFFSNFSNHLDLFLSISSRWQFILKILFLKCTSEFRHFAMSQPL